jgi:hypothetical protein
MASKTIDSGSLQGLAKPSRLWAVNPNKVPAQAIGRIENQSLTVDLAELRAAEYC